MDHLPSITVPGIVHRLNLHPRSWYRVTITASNQVYVLERQCIREYALTKEGAEQLLATLKTTRNCIYGSTVGPTGTGWFCSRLECVTALLEFPDKIETLFPNGAKDIYGEKSTWPKICEFWTTLHNQPTGLPAMSFDPFEL
jgi:hypothetical protein